jgi:hypothetical protein
MKHTGIYLMLIFLLDVFNVQAQRGQSVRRGTRYLCRWSGGEALVEGKRIIGTVPWARPIAAGKQYLMLFSDEPSNKRLVIASRRGGDEMRARLLFD